MKILVSGWFSFEGMGATAGDLLARDVVRAWLSEAGIPHDVAVAPPFTDGIDWRVVDPVDYSHLLFVCGPFGNGPPLTDMLDRFSACALVGIDVSLLQPLDAWDPFDILFERDSSTMGRADITFASTQPRVPIAGVVLVHPQAEYGTRAMHGVANAAIDRLLAVREASIVRIDTRLDENATGQRTAAEVESLIARMDVVLTTRLHGTVLALKNGVPAVAVDPIAGGAKIARQARTIGWPVVFTAEEISDDALVKAYDWCLTDDAREQARECGERAKRMVLRERDAFLAAFAGYGRSAA